VLPCETARETLCIPRDSERTSPIGQIVCQHGEQHLDMLLTQRRRGILTGDSSIFVMKRMVGLVVEEEHCVENPLFSLPRLWCIAEAVTPASR
jgi:hypothetical protein